MKLRRVFLTVFGATALVMLAACTPPDDGGGTTTTTTTVSGAPVAVASAAPTVGDAPLDVVFDSTGSSPGTGTGLTYTWDFGDGSPTATGTTATHTYAAGNFTATLTMTSSAGTSTSPGIAITSNVDPNPKFYVRPAGTDSGTCGPKADPCATIGQAQTNAVANGGIHLIRVAGGNYNGPLSVVSNMEISGGWAQDFSAYGVGEITAINGTGTAVPVTFAGVSNSKLNGVNVQGATRSGGDAVGLLVNGGSTGIAIGSNDTP
ncbi:MAG: PKD domain-containing protein, partial [Actinobacteria bacterium]|nr:PKD domain-containing protein [Actinomycetota bacterium]